MAKIKALIILSLGKSKTWQLNIFNPFPINITFNLNTLLYAFNWLLARVLILYPIKTSFQGVLNEKIDQK